MKLNEMKKDSLKAKLSLIDRASEETNSLFTKFTTMIEKFGLGSDNEVKVRKANKI